MKISTLFIGCLAAVGDLVAAVSPGPGVTQPTFSEEEIGTVIGEVGAEVTGGRITIAGISNGYLYTAISNKDSEHAWWDISDPRNPVRVHRQSQWGDKPHSIGFFGGGRYGVVRTNGRPTSLYDFVAFDRVSMAPALPGESQVRYSMWSALQGHLLFRTVSGYVSEAPLMEVYDVRDPGEWRHLATIDMAALTGFKVAAVHPLGNLMVVSAAEARGVATLDISDPLDPQLIDVNTAGVHDKIYVSILRGRRLYTASNSGQGIEVYDIDADGAITLIGRPQLLHRNGSVQASVQQKYVIFKDDRLWSCWNGQPNNLVDAETLEHLQGWDLGDGQGAATVEEPDSGGRHAEFILPIGNMVVEVWNGIRIRAIEHEPDARGPRVLAADPVAGRTQVAVTGRCGFAMSEPILPDSVDTTSVILRPLGGEPIAAETSVQQHVLINIAPLEPLAADTVYEVVLPAGGVRDLVGNPIAETVSIRFSTGEHLGGRTVAVTVDGRAATVIHGGGVVAEPVDGTAVFRGLDGGSDQRFTFGAGAIDGNG